MEKYNNKIAIVTGASSGIGAAIVKLLLINGMKVVGLARRKEKIEQLGSEMTNCYSKNLYAVKADVTKEEEILEAFRWTTANVGPLSVLVNNAGVMKPNQIINGKTDNWKAVLETNLLGVAIACREAIKIMKENKVENGYIFNINSIAGHEIFDVPGMNMYQVSKHGITALTKQLRNELRSEKLSIRSTSISPGYVTTELFAEMPEFEQHLTNGLKAEDVADAIKYILSIRPEVEITELTIRCAGAI